MSSAPPSLAHIVDRLGALHGEPDRPPTTDPFELIVWENCAYLVNDERRREVFETLRSTIGVSPAALLAARTDVLAETIEPGGMHPPRRAQRLVECAEIATNRFGGDLTAVLREPLPKARRELQRFPGCGAPGAEKILLLTGAHPVLALESNGLRTLVRLGIADEGKSYAATYKAVREALAPQLPTDVAWIARAHLLLRAHGKSTCKNTVPLCEACPLSPQCAWRAANAD